MHRTVDVAGAVTKRGWPGTKSGAVTFALVDDLAPWNAGTWRLEMADGRAELTRSTTEAPFILTIRAFALLYCGAVRATSLVRSGQLSAQGGSSPSDLDILGGAATAQDKRHPTHVDGEGGHSAVRDTSVAEGS